MAGVELQEDQFTEERAEPDPSDTAINNDNDDWCGATGRSFTEKGGKPDNSITNLLLLFICKKRIACMSHLSRWPLLDQ